MKSQNLPSTSAATDVGPAAASAAASVGKVLSRQYSGACGSCDSGFSPIALITNLPSPCASVGGNATRSAISKNDAKKRASVQILVSSSAHPGTATSWHILDETR